jgi:hypothetical protein
MLNIFSNMAQAVQTNNLEIKIFLDKIQINDINTATIKIENSALDTMINSPCQFLKDQLGNKINQFTINNTTAADVDISKKLPAIMNIINNLFNTAEKLITIITKNVSNIDLDYLKIKQKVDLSIQETNVINVTNIKDNFQIYIYSICAMNDKISNQIILNSTNIYFSMDGKYISCFNATKKLKNIHFKANSSLTTDNLIFDLLHNRIYQQKNYLYEYAYYDDCPIDNYSNIMNIAYIQNINNKILNTRLKSEKFQTTNEETVFFYIGYKYGHISINIIPSEQPELFNQITTQLTEWAKLDKLNIEAMDNQVKAWIDKLKTPITPTPEYVTRYLNDPSNYKSAFQFEFHEELPNPAKDPADSPKDQKILAGSNPTITEATISNDIKEEQGKITKIEETIKKLNTKIDTLLDTLNKYIPNTKLSEDESINHMENKLTLKTKLTNVKELIQLQIKDIILMKNTLNTNDKSKICDLFIEIMKIEDKDINEINNKKEKILSFDLIQLKNMMIEIINDTDLNLKLMSTTLARLEAELNKLLQSSNEGIIPSNPKTPIENPDPKTPINNPDPKPSAENPGPKIPINNPDPKPSAENPGPKIPIENPGPKIPNKIPGTETPIENPGPAKDNKDTPFYKKGWFIFLCIVAVILIAAYLLVPSTEKSTTTKEDMEKPLLLEEIKPLSLEETDDEEFDNYLV